MYHWELPTDVPRAYFGIDVSRQGEQYHLMDRLIPFVLYAPKGFTPYALRPGVRTVFAIRGDETDPAIYADRRYRLYTPKDELWGDEADGLIGWADLPTQLTGLWILELIEGDSNMTQRFRVEDWPTVRSRNLYPVFAMESRDLWFDPANLPKPPLPAMEPLLRPFEPPRWRRVAN